jgi:signal transduction histidine kinase
MTAQNGITRSIRTKLIMVLVIGAVMPLALIGVWLTRTVVRAGESLLRGELESSVATVGDAVGSRWEEIRSDLGLVAANDVAQHILERGATALPPAMTEYLAQLHNSVAVAIASFEYRDVRGRPVWESPRDTIVARWPNRRVVSSPRRTIPFRVAVTSGATGDTLGVAIANVKVSALVPSDTSLRLPAGAMLGLVRDESGEDVLSGRLTPEVDRGRERFSADNDDWLAVHRAVADAGLTVTLAAPLRAYVTPFERAAQNGMIILSVVALLALAVSVWLTTRLTRSLARLAVAADAVAAGDLEHRVNVDERDETGRVALAFNSMIESLRTTLAELSKRQALAAVGEYSAALTHEMRNGLTTVRVDLQSAQEKAQSGAPEHRLIARALDGVQRLDARIASAMRVAREPRQPRRRVDLREAIDGAVRKAEGAFAERGATVDAQLNKNGPAWVLADPAGIDQLFLNLLYNAAQALARGGRATITVEQNGADACVVISDNGSGILPNDLQRVQEPFYSTKPGGTGLGLPIARQIATAHGGTLHIASEVGAYTRVEVRLPLVVPPANRGSKSERMEEQRGGGESAKSEAEVFSVPPTP